MNRVGALVVSAVILAMPGTLPPPAWGAADVSHTWGRREVVTVEDFVIPCLDTGIGDLTIIINGNQREVTNANTYHFGESVSGTWTAVWVGGGTSAGRATTTFGIERDTAGDRAAYHDIFTGVVTSGLGLGTRWHSLAHFVGSIDPEGRPIDGSVRAVFNSVRCG